MLTRTLWMLLGAVLCSAVWAQDRVPGRQVNLNAPGAMETLEATNPAHYLRIQQIVAGLSERGYDAVPGWIRTTFDAKDVSYSELLLVSLPPQRRLSFTLDDTHYRATITLEWRRAQIYPTRH
jgi:hypothetical protein